METMVAVFFGVLTAFFGYMLLSREYFYDLWIFVLCFVIAKCQFSLLKVCSHWSCQHNNHIRLFCILCNISGSLIKVFNNI